MKLDEIKINVIDIGKEFNEILRNKKTSGYLLGENVSIALIDTIKVRNNENASLELSKKRGLHLTIDGVHLNAIGAEIYKNSINKQILIG